MEILSISELNTAQIIEMLVGGSLLIFSAYISFPLTNWLVQKSFNNWYKYAESEWTKAFFHTNLTRKVALIAPSLIIQIAVGLVPHVSKDVTSIIKNIAVSVTIFYLLRVLLALLDIFENLQVQNALKEKRPKAIKSYVQLSKILLIILGTIVIISTLIDRSPLIFLSGIGAMSAVLLIVFKDTLTSFVAGIQLTATDMLRVGDWIEMPQVGADGEVTEIALHTVRVQNWDKTITAVPTWRLMSESFKNWRGMAESGGRRIKKVLVIDSSSVRFLSEDDLKRLKRAERIKLYLESREESIKLYHNEVETRIGSLSHDRLNRRSLTNLGTFRAYVDLYLNEHPLVHDDMTRIVRVMESSAEGIPLEVYCFTTTTKWKDYENIQSDIFEHFFAILPEFGLRLYQKPGSGDFRTLLK